MLHFRTVSPLAYVRLSKFLHSTRIGTMSVCQRLPRVACAPVPSSDRPAREATGPRGGAALDLGERVIYAGVAVVLVAAALLALGATTWQLIDELDEGTIPSVRHALD